MEFPKLSRFLGLIFRTFAGSPVARDRRPPPSPPDHLKSHRTSERGGAPLPARRCPAQGCGALRSGCGSPPGRGPLRTLLAHPPFLRPGCRRCEACGESAASLAFSAPLTPLAYRSRRLGFRPSLRSPAAAAAPRETGSRRGSAHHSLRGCASACARRSGARGAAGSLPERWAAGRGGVRADPGPVALSRGTPRRLRGWPLSLH